ncbi:MAG: hypothetical protein IKY20_06475 [Alistipes sp.]|nr:hypothetical protein [Alistipes sp.]
MEIIKKLALLAVVACGFVACVSEADNNPVNPSEQIEEVGFVMPMEATRTAIGPDGMSTRWAEGDKLSVWALNSEGSYTFENMQFTMRYFSPEYDKAYFVSNISEMAEGDYTYFLSYPKPNSINGTQVTYSVSSVQSGAYDGKYDIMIAEPATASALSATHSVELNTIMRHQMHAVKITVPEGRNLYGERFYRLEITFPNDVVGDITLDITDPNAEPVYSNTSNVVVLESAEGFDAGSEIWAFVLPGTVEGEVNYFVKGEVRKSNPASYSLSKEFVKGHVTPIRMAIPEIYPYYTAAEFTIANNFLGEEYNTVTILAADGTSLGTFDRSENGKYLVYAESDTFDVDVFDNTTWKLVFDSDNAIVAAEVPMGDMTDFSEHFYTTDVPYILFENFENVTESESYGNNSYASEDRDQPGVSLDGAMPTNGWNAARYWLKPGAMRINARYQCVKILIAFASSHYGRMDTPLLWNGSYGIKPGKDVKIKLQFDAALYQHGDSSSTITSSGIAVATHTNANNPIDGIPTGTKGLGSTYDTTLEDFGTTLFSKSMSSTVGDNAFGQTFPTYSTEFAVTSESRICFYPTISCEDGGVNNAEINVYLDNIKVQIAK